MKAIIIAICISVVYSSGLYPEDPVENDFISKNFENIEAFNVSVVTANSFPFVVSLQIYQDATHINNCAGVIVSTVAVLTTATCISGTSRVEIIAGVHNRDMVEQYQQRRVILPTNYVVHNLYNSSKYAYNVAMLRTPGNPFILNAFVQQARLPIDFTGESFTGEVARTLSWGRVSEQIASSSTLRQLFNSVIANSVCAPYYTEGTVNDNTICVQTTAANPNFCSTSVLTVNRPGDIRPVLVGLTKFLPPSCGVARPYGFVRITSFLTWISMYS
ncbi:brachyurin-like [Chironomus tepperi]|uniref:brachyurin-like n=1 Tax=Chironomus tepperi TaxID=113505 RepID=UPI00391EE9B9